ncbi:hypothetical protein [Candidatus Nitrosarchaeum limnium]|nr:hypothetical protein [Candidatus Nitrosarchaeum limnium]
MHQCYYCEQIFDTKEALYDHVEIHSDIERNREIMDKKRKQKRTNSRFTNKIILNKITVKVRKDTFRNRNNNFKTKTMDWVESLLKRSCDKTLTKEEVLRSLFHMIEINENTLNHIQADKRDFGPELEKLKQTEIKDLDFHLKYYRSLVNYINSIPENKIIRQ